MTPEQARPRRASDDVNDEARTLAANYLDRLDEHSAVLAARVQQEIPEYANVPLADIRLGLTALLSTVLMRLERRADPTQIAVLDEIAREHAAQGIPLEGLAHSIEFVAREVHRVIAADAQTSGIDSGAVLQMCDSAWQFASDAAARIAAINKELAVELARRDNDRRADFLRAVLYGGIDQSRIHAEAPLFGLDPTRRYHPIRARPAAERDEHALTLAIGRTGSTLHHRAVLGVLEGELVGLVPERPDVDDGLLVAIGEQCELTDAPEAFQVTRVTLDAAGAFGRSGVVSLGELGPLPLALAAHDLADVLEREHFGWLREEVHGDRDVEDTVRTLLEHDQNVERAAQVLHVHPNTVRYRLGRFRELTNLEIRRTDDLVTAWWLLKRRQAARNGS